MIFASDWRVDPDGRDTEDRKNGPVTTYHMSQGDMAKYKEGVKLMNEIKEVMEEKKVEDAMEYKAEKKKKSDKEQRPCYGGARHDGRRNL